MLHESQQERLNQDLTALHEMLENVEEMDEKTKAAMRLVADDMSRFLEGKQESADDWAHFGKRWREAVLDFESQHPRLAQVVEQITSMLAGAGI